MSGLTNFVVGGYTEQDRKNFMDRFALEYHQRHPGERPSYARRQARIRWARKLRREGVR